ncbi:MAG: transposase [Planctomycetaceae bacterium]|nr:transposase [Planctomycetaceae bacterium]
MARTRYKVCENASPHFMTCTIVGWLPIFTRQEFVNEVFESWRFLQRERDFKLFAYVILENHLHLIASAPELADAMKSFKSYTARRIIDRLKELSATTLLDQLRAHKLRHKINSEFQVWQEGIHAQQIESEDVMWQKIEYIHNNPVKRGYIEDPVHWRYSSARNYAGLPGLIDVVTDWR